jgi:peptide-methionine (S)-S-oxide reductase
MSNRAGRLVVSGVIFVAVVLAGGWLAVQKMHEVPDIKSLSRSPIGPPPPEFQQATFAGGFFWCTQVLFQQLKGVHSTVSGYSGGSAVNPTYAQICNGTTGHTEAVQITFDPTAISYAELLEIFWRTHDPTTRDRQGNDHGPQYRSVIFCHNPVTEIVPFAAFYPAEEHHQNYFVDNPRQGYCAAIIGPKLKKFEKAFADKLKPDLHHDP